MVLPHTSITPLKQQNYFIINIPAVRNCILYQQLESLLVEWKHIQNRKIGNSTQKKIYIQIFTNSYHTIANNNLF